MEIDGINYMSEEDFYKKAREMMYESSERLAARIKQEKIRAKKDYEKKV